MTTITIEQAGKYDGQEVTIKALVELLRLAHQSINVHGA